MEAATKVFLRAGNAHAGVADIAREAGGAKPTIYAHFGSEVCLQSKPFHRRVIRTPRYLIDWQKTPFTTLRQSLRQNPGDCYVIEYPDGRRYLQRSTWLADRKAWRVETLRRLSNAPR